MAETLVSESTQESAEILSAPLAGELDSSLPREASLAGSALEGSPNTASDLKAFSQLSKQLSSSYGVLESRVDELTDELSRVEAKRAQELLEKENITERLEGLLNVLPGGVVVIDEQGFVTEVNPAARDMLGEPLEGQRWRDVIQRCFSPRSDDGHEVSTHDGRRISIATRSMVENGQIVLLTDQTETRRLQGELSRHERLSALGQMVSALAHQIRTPLSAAMLYAGHLCEGELSPQQQQNFSGKVLKRLNHMERQVQDMLMFVKGELPLNDVLSCHDFQQQLEEEMEVLISSNNAQCHWHNHCPDELMRCHKDALMGALLNLVNNSVQAIQGSAELHISFSRSADNHVAISVSDNGPGINADALQSVKDVFVTTKAQGTGLGLAVVESVARRHGGEFNLSSVCGEGTTATMRLPLLKQQAKGTTSPVQYDFSAGFNSPVKPSFNATTSMGA